MSLHPASVLAHLELSADSLNVASIDFYSRALDWLTLLLHYLFPSIGISLYS